jgi:YgiT-type zinc finger domain-containing protein
MTCFFCKGKKENHVTIDVTDLGSCVVIVRGVPCYKCTKCGEITFELKTGERIEEIIDTLKESMAGEIAVIEYSPTEIKFVQYTKTVAA